MVIKQTSEQAHVANLVRGLYEIRQTIADAKREEARLTEAVKEYMAEEGVEALDIEGAPPCVLKTRSTGTTWDSHAIRAMQEQRPQEWQRVCELGAVRLSVDVLRRAIANGQLAGMPAGGIEGTREYLTFEDKR